MSFSQALDIPSVRASSGGFRVPRQRTQAATTAAAEGQLYPAPAPAHTVGRQTAQACREFEAGMARWTDAHGQFVFKHSLAAWPDFFADAQCTVVDTGAAAPFIQFPEEEMRTGRVHTLLVKAPQACGKTTALSKFIAASRATHPTILIVTPRQCVAYRFVQALKAVGVESCHYETTPSIKVGAVNICQLDSLPRFLYSDHTAFSARLARELCDTAAGSERLRKIRAALAERMCITPQLDGLFIDEVEALLDHLCSPTLCKRGLMPRDAFVGSVRHASLVVAMQAELSDHTFDFMYSIRGVQTEMLTGVRETGIRLLWRTALPPPKRVVRVLDRLRLGQILDEAVGLGKRLCILSDSKRAVEDYHRRLLDVHGVGADRCLVYTSGTDNKRSLAVCEDVWNQYDFVLYSPTVSFGVDFNPATVHFDAVFADFAGCSIDGQCAFQMINRVRKLRDNLVFFYGPSASSKSKKPKAAGHGQEAGPQRPLLEPGAAPCIADFLRGTVNKNLYSHHAFDSYARPPLAVASFSAGGAVEVDTPFEVLVRHKAMQRALGRCLAARHAQRALFTTEVVNQVRLCGYELALDMVAVVAEEREARQFSVAGLRYAAETEHLLHVLAAEEVTDSEYEHLAGAQASSASADTREHCMMLKFRLRRDTGWGRVWDPAGRLPAGELRRLLLCVGYYRSSTGAFVHLDNVRDFVLGPGQQGSHWDLATSPVNDLAVQSVEASQLTCFHDLLAALGVDAAGIATGCLLASGERGAGRQPKRLKQCAVPDGVWARVQSLCAGTGTASFLLAFGVQAGSPLVKHASADYGFVGKLLQLATKQLFGVPATLTVRGGRVHAELGCEVLDLVALCACGARGTGQDDLPFAAILRQATNFAPSFQNAALDTYLSVVYVCMYALVLLKIDLGKFGWSRMHGDTRHFI